MPFGLVIGAAVAYVVKDLALYPAMRCVFRPPEGTRPIGKRGEVVHALDPLGYIRIEGELWQAKSPASSVPLPVGCHVVVRAAEGLMLLVEEADPR